MGRLHAQTGKYIDLWIHIDVPLDVALARRTIRDFKRDPRSVHEVLEELQHYLDHSRPMFFTEEEKKGADLVVDGTLNIDKLVKLIQAKLN